MDALSRGPSPKAFDRASKFAYAALVVRRPCAPLSERGRSRPALRARPLAPLVDRAPRPLDPPPPPLTPRPV